MILNLRPCVWWPQMRSGWKVNRAEATVEFSQPITIAPQSSDISRIWGMRKREQVSLARFQLGESSRVSGSVQPGSHSSMGLLTLIISLVWGGIVEESQETAKALKKSCMQCSSDYCPCAWAKKIRGKQQGLRKGGLNLSVNFVQIYVTALKTPPPTALTDIHPLCVKQTFVDPERMSNLSPRSVRESDIPLLHFGHPLLSSPLLPHPFMQTPYLQLPSPPFPYCKEKRSVPKFRRTPSPRGWLQPQEFIPLEERSSHTHWETYTETITRRIFSKKWKKLFESLDFCLCKYIMWQCHPWWERDY